MPMWLTVFRFLAGGRTMIDNNHGDENGGDDNTDTE